MFTVTVEKECGCFLRSDLTNNQSIATKDEAMDKALEMANYMNETFCQKHEFKVREEGNTFLIGVDMRAPKEHVCCGGGCH